VKERRIISNIFAAFVVPRTKPTQLLGQGPNLPSRRRRRSYLSLSCYFTQGVRTKTVKKSARTIVEKYYTRLTTDFHTNKRLVDDVAILPSKRMRNKIAGYTTHLMRRIAKGPVRGISLKLQEEERERRMDFVPEVSALDQDTIQIDPDTRDLLESLGYSSLNGVAVNQAHNIRD
jgi:small subunit ribosomal protein S17e